MGLKVLSEEFLKHLEDFKIVESEPIKQNNQNNNAFHKQIFLPQCMKNAHAPLPRDADFYVFYVF